MKETILIIRYGALGDTLLLRPMVEYFQQLYPESSIYLAGHPERMHLLAGLCGGDITVLDYDRHLSWLHMDQQAPGAEITQIIRGAARVMFFTSRPDGPAAKRLQRWAGQAVKTCVALPKEKNTRHAALFYFEQVGIHYQAKELVRQVESWPELSRREERGEPLVILSPGAGSRKKRRPVAFWRRLVQGIISRSDVRLAVLLGPAEEDEEFASLAAPDAERITPVRQSLRGLRGFVASAGVYVGNDSGPTHLAAMTGVPTLALFGPSNPFQWGPLGSRSQAIRDGKLYHFPAWILSSGASEKNTESIQDDCQEALRFILSHLQG